MPEGLFVAPVVAGQLTPLSFLLALYIEFDDLMLFLVELSLTSAGVRV